MVNVLPGVRVESGDSHESEERWRAGERPVTVFQTCWQIACGGFGAKVWWLRGTGRGTGQWGKYSVTVAASRSWAVDSVCRVWFWSPEHRNSRQPRDWRVAGQGAVAELWRRPRSAGWVPPPLPNTWPRVHAEIVAHWAVSLWASLPAHQLQAETWKFAFYPSEYSWVLWNWGMMWTLLKNISEIANAVFMEALTLGFLNNEACVVFRRWDAWTSCSVVWVERNIKLEALCLWFSQVLWTNEKKSAESQNFNIGHIPLNNWDL